MKVLAYLTTLKPSSPATSSTPVVLRITAWLFDVEPGNPDFHNGGYTFHLFQVWRPSPTVQDNGCYSLVGVNRFKKQWWYIECDTRAHQYHQCPAWRCDRIPIHHQQCWKTQSSRDPTTWKPSRRDHMVPNWCWASDEWTRCSAMSIPSGIWQDTNILNWSGTSFICDHL